jgi:branched-chain amino acid transport system ATP-binding protein
VLELHGIQAGYGQVPVLRGVSLSVGEGEIVTLIGSNGAGKSTILRAISRLIPVRAGTIHFRGELISHSSSHLVVRRGLVHIPEGRRLFTDMTVRENLLLGGYTCARRELDERLAQVFEWFPVLGERERQLARSLSGGEQQMVAIARGLMTQPVCVMLDEPSLGLAPMLVGQVAEMIRAIRARGITVMLVEQNARLALELADRAYVLQTGRIALEGPSREVLGNQEVRAAYLGL